jgi:hypothetical protein
MEFVQSTFLFALAGLAIPVIIHLIHGRQTRRVQLGSTRFLVELLRQTARRRRLKRWLLLGLRLGCVALLALLFARPYLLAEQQGAGRRFRVFLIDKSASMSLRTSGERLLDQAFSRVQSLVRQLPVEDRYEIGLFDTQVAAPAVEQMELQNWKAPKAIFGGTSFGGAMSWARDVCLKSGAASQEIVLYTDLQRSGLDWAEDTRFPPQIRVTIEDLGRDGVNNIAVTKAVPVKTLLRPGEGTTIAVTLFNDGQFSLDDVPVLLTLKQGNRSVHREAEISLSPGQATQLEFEIAGLEAGLWEGTVIADVTDELTFDNRSHLAILAARQQRVLLVDGSFDDSPVSQTFFLQRAMSLAPHGETAEESPFVVKTTRYEYEGRLPVLNETDLVVLSNVRLSEVDSQALSTFVRAGGGLLVLTGDRMTPEGTQTLRDAGLAPGQITGLQKTRDLPYRWDTWKSDTSLLAPFADPQNGDLRSLSFLGYTQLIPDPQTELMATFNTGAPALTMHQLGRGRIFWFLSGCDPTWGTWSRGRLFLPLIHQLLGELAHLTGGGPVQFHSLADWNLVLGDTVTSDPKPGVVEHEGRWHVFNVAPAESETERCTPADLAKRLRFELAEEELDESGQNHGQHLRTELESRRDEIWPLCACLLVGLVCAEWFFSNRTTA